jgi:hypothetical protein
MHDTEFLRQAMRAETTDLPMYLPIDRIHRRARGLRAVRRATVAGACALVVAAVAVPGYALLDRARPAGQPVGGPPVTATASQCAHPTFGAPDYPLLGPVVATGARLEGRGGPWDIVLALTGPRQYPDFTVAFLDAQTGEDRLWDMTGVRPGPEGDFSAKGRTYQFLSHQLPLAPNRVLDMGIYSRTAARITVASEGHGVDAHISPNAATGWTFFWVERTARPLPADALNGPQEYTGPERLTITAYDAAGHILHTITGGFNIGGRPSNPRDNSPDPHGSPTPGAPCS